MPEILSTLAAPAENGAALQGNVLVCPAENGATEYSLGGTYTPPPAPPGGTPTAPSTAATYTISARQAYVVAHVRSVVDMRDGLELPIESLSMANDADALFWTLRASGGAELFTRLQAGEQPAAVRVTLDGQVWEFVVDSVVRSRAFPTAAVQVTGRSVTSAAGAPYEFEQNWAVDGDTTAAQIASSANLLTGLEVVWGLADWPVPDRVFTHFGTPLSVVKRVADAAGAIVQSDRVGYTVRVLPRYPLLPNEWPVVAPDVEIAVDALDTESFERADRPEYDGVYCLGQQQGAFAFVRLAGTSGAQLHPMVTDLLLTDDVACGLRGHSILGASGQQQTHRIRLPVLSGAGEPGVLDVGMLLRIVEPSLTWYGLVRSVDVESVMPQAWQTVQLERHIKPIAGTVTTPPATTDPLLFTGPIADQVFAPGAAVSLALAPYWSLGVPPYTWSMRSGVLPAWLELDEATGLVTGTAPGSAVPATPLAFRATDGIDSTADSNVLNLSVVAASTTLVLGRFNGTDGQTASILNEGTLGGSYTAFLGAALSSTQKKFGATSARIPNLNLARIQILATGGAISNRKLTSELWVYVDAGAAVTAGLVMASVGFLYFGTVEATADGHGFVMVADSSLGSFGLHCSSKGAIMNPTAVVLAREAWHHLSASTDSAGVVRWFVNGILQAGTATIAAATRTLNVYQLQRSLGPTNGPAVYVDDVSMRYDFERTANFTPPGPL